MAGKLEWHGDRVKAAIRAEMTRRVRLCALLVWNRAKELLNVDGTGVRAAATKGPGGKRKRKGTLVYGAHPSQPGEPPRKQRGRLLGSVAWEVDGLEGRVGTNLAYGRWLELGTRLMAARPWLRRALAECRDRLLAILSAPIKGPD